MRLPAQPPQLSGKHLVSWEAPRERPGPAWWEERGKRKNEGRQCKTVSSENNPRDAFQRDPRAESHTVLSKASPRGFGVAGDLPFRFSSRSSPLSSPGCSGRSQRQHQERFPAKMKENSPRPRKAEKGPRPRLEALREVSGDQMSVQAAPESTTGTGCSPEHRAQRSYLDPQLVFRRESLKWMYLKKKN